MPLPQPASLRDRTSEFLAIVERLQKQPGYVLPSQAGSGPSTSSSSSVYGSGSGPFDPAKAQIAQHSEFSRRAADIGHAVHRTSLKLQKLTQLAKRTSAFDDPAQEVDELTGIIKADINSLNSAIADLQRLSSKAPKDGNTTGSKQATDHNHTVVDNLRSRLKDATLEFKDVLTLRTDNLKHHRERRQLFSSNTDPEAALPLLARSRNGQGSPFGASSSAAASSAAASNGPPSTPSFMQASSAQQQQQQVVLAPQDNYQSSRAEALRNVENTIVELGSIFNKLSELVQEQGELAIRIDENMDDTLQNVNLAQNQLLKYLNTISSNRWLMLKVFGVLLVFLVFFIVFIA